MTLPSPPGAEQVEVLASPLGPASAFPFAVLRTLPEGAPPLRVLVHSNSFGCFNLLAQGEVRAAEGLLPGQFLTGPFSTPLATVARGPLVSLSLVVQPWALEPLFGVAAAALTNRLRAVSGPAAPALPALRAAGAALCEGGLDAARFWSALAPLAADLRPPDLHLQVLRGCGVEAAARAAGCSARHYRRRFAHAMGLAPAVWLRITRWEAALLALGSGEAAEGLAALSADRGYADQAHLTRETRAFVRDTPSHLRRALRAGGGPWSLRPAAVRFVQDGREPAA